MPTEIDELLRRSTQQAQQAAQMIGGTFEQGRGFRLNSSIIAPQTQIPYQTPAYVPLTPIASLDATIPEMKLTPSETEASGLSKRLRELTEGLVGESAYRIEQEELQDISELQKTQKDLSAQLKSLQAEAQAIPLQLQQEAEGRGITAGGLAPIQAGRLRENAIKALTISSLLEASRGNLAFAYDLVDRAVKVKYDPIREEIAVKKANLELIIASPEYSIEEKNRANKQKEAQDKIQKEQEQKENEQKEIHKIAVEAAKNGADALTLQKIINAKNQNEALGIAVEAKAMTKPEKITTTKEVIYTDKTLPPDLRSDIIDTLIDKEGAKILGKELTLLDMMNIFPNVDRETLRSYMDEFYDYEELIKGEKATTKKWWQFWK